jgi:hypothetical protein
LKILYCNLYLYVLLFNDDHLSRGLEFPLFWTTAARIVEVVEVGSSGTRGILGTFPLNFPASSWCGVPSPGPCFFLYLFFVFFLLELPCKQLVRGSFSGSLMCASMYTYTYRCTCTCTCRCICIHILHRDVYVYYNMYMRCICIHITRP